MPHEAVCYIQPRDAVVNMERPKSFPADTRAFRDGAAPSHDTFRPLPKTLVQKESAFRWQFHVGRVHTQEDDRARGAWPDANAVLFWCF